MKKCVSIGGVSICLDLEKYRYGTNFAWDDFSVPGDFPCDAVWQIENRQDIEYPAKTTAVHNIVSYCRHESDQSYSFWFNKEYELPFELKYGRQFLRASSDWKHVSISTEGEEFHPLRVVTLSLLAYQSLSAYLGAVLCHGSCVEYDNHAVVFSAVSGTGKSTHADLWVQHLGARYINGDKIILRDLDGIRAFGSPWSGSSEYKFNTSAPLKALVVLRQAPENRIRRLDMFEAVHLYSPNCYIPYWDEAAAGHVMETLDKVVSSVPVYLLECLPDADAAKLARDTIYGA